MNSKKIRENLEKELRVVFLNFVKSTIEKIFKIEVVESVIVQNTCALAFRRNLDKKTHVNVLNVMENIGCSLMGEEFNARENLIYVVFR